jgi:uncharacterized membrane protein
MDGMRGLADHVHGFMVWNSILALVPLALAMLLFRADRPAKRTGLWWAGVVAFVAFLPNAPYVLTDVVHLIQDVRITHSPAQITLLVLPAYAAFFFLGVESYTLCLRRVRRALGNGLHAWAVEAGLHGVCALGIYLGRFARLNSWDIVRQPATVLTHATLAPMTLVGVTFVIIAGVALVLEALTFLVEGWWRLAYA